jgi:putative membrane protein
VHRRRGFVGWIIGGLLILLLIGLFATPFFFGRYYGITGPYYYPHPFFGFFFFPFGFLFFFLIFFVFRWLLFPWRRGYHHGQWYHGGGAEEILKERYARGEITKEQFDQMMRDIEQKK